MERREFLNVEAFGGLSTELWVNMSEIRNVKLRGILKEDASGNLNVDKGGILSKGVSGSADDFLNVEARRLLSGDISDIVSREMDETLNGDAGCLQNGDAKAIPSRDVSEPYSKFHPCVLLSLSPPVLP